MDKNKQRYLLLLKRKPCAQEHVHKLCSKEHYVEQIEYFIVQQTCDFEKAFVTLQSHCLGANLSRPLQVHDTPKSLRMILNFHLWDPYTHFC